MNALPVWMEIGQKALDKYSGKTIPDELARAINSLNEVSALEPRVRGNSTISASVLWAGLGEYPLNKVFGSPGKITPDEILDGAIICVNLPLYYGSAAKVAFVLWKLAVQKLLLGRAPKQ